MNQGTERNKQGLGTEFKNEHFALNRKYCHEKDFEEINLIFGVCTSMHEDIYFYFLMRYMLYSHTACSHAFI